MTEKEISNIYRELEKLGPILPGTLSEQWNVCGQQGCRCKDKKNPVKHGPYYQLSYTIGGKSSTMFVKQERLEEVRKGMRNYRKFKELYHELLLASVLQTRTQGTKKNAKKAAKKKTKSRKQG